jgi:hypothetical protein
MRQHQSVHRAGHVHIGKDDMNADRLTFQNSERLTGMAALITSKSAASKALTTGRQIIISSSTTITTITRGATLGPWK